MTSFLGALGLKLKKSIVCSSVSIHQLRAGTSLFQYYWNTMGTGWASWLANLVISNKMEAMEITDISVWWGSVGLLKIK